MNTYASKYAKYITHNSNRFAEEDEIKNAFSKYDGKNSGTPVYYDRDEMYINTDNGMHEIIIGPTSCKKTSCCIINRVITTIKAHQSIIVNDSKGEIYSATSGLAKKEGLKTRIVDLKKFGGDSWNPYMHITKLYKQGKKEKAENLLNDLLNRIAAPAVNVRDTYWTDMAESLLRGISLMLMDSSPKPEYVSFKSIANLLNGADFNDLLAITNRLNPTSLAYTSIKGALPNAEKTRSCIFSTVSQILEPFTNNSSLMKMMIEDTVEIEKIAVEPTIIYLIYPDEVNTLDFIINTFFSQAYEILISLADESKEGCLQTCVNLIIDEFGNMPAIADMSQRISKSRSANIRYTLCIQSLQQLEEKYDKAYESIISNCGLWIVFPTREIGLLNRLSEIGGNIRDYNGITHPLIDPVELQYLEKCNEYAEAVVLKMGLRPYITRLKDYRHIEEFSGEISKLCEAGKIYVAKYNDFWENEKYILSFEQWYRYIRNGERGFHFPFTVEEQYNDIDSSNEEDDNEADEINSVDCDMLRKQLKDKFTELFGPLSDDETEGE